METLTVVAEQFKMNIAIEQGDYTHEASFSFNNTPNINDVSNLVLNEVYSFLAINKMLLSSKNRPSMAKPFTFCIEFEQGDNTLLLSDFSTKVSFGLKAQEKLINNFPMVLAQLLLPKNISVAERQAILMAPKEIELVLA